MSKGIRLWKDTAFSYETNISYETLLEELRKFSQEEKAEFIIEWLGFDYDSQTVQKVHDLIHDMES